jgi:non-ribosomal peptide synthetase component E (peptide arylation enzyme)
MIRKWTEAGAWEDKTLIDYFKDHIRTQPDKVCLVDPLNKEALVGLKPERLTYRVLDHAADSTAEALLALWIKKDDIIMVQIPNTWELAMLYLAPDRRLDFPHANAMAGIRVWIHRRFDRVRGDYHRG